MEAPLSLTTTTTLLSITKTLGRSSATGRTIRTQSTLIRSRPITTTTAPFQRSSTKFSSKSPLFRFETATGATLSPIRCRLNCVSSSAASFSSSSGSDSVDDVSALSTSDVIILDVRGMMCGGCASSVKRILENQSQVSSASVNHTTETAVVWPISEAKATPNWQKLIGEELAKNLTNSGFDSNLRGEAAKEQSS
ncbi:copper-transporting ATPase PAA1, chloroplastic-like [Rutidosis leptorrhynchoides]|uniref:copper-transporting ATPase PAA1, chloroplastic-like n=1 Tax=Rutidosis leptorrhynchoides TaxID=125765 RepID=UPI003A999845